MAFNQRGKTLPQEHVGVTVRMVVHDCDDFESVLGIKRRSLEAERHEKHLSTAAPARLVLCCFKQSRSHSVIAERLLDPELTNFRAPAPRIPAYPGNDPIVAKITRNILDKLSVDKAAH